MARFSVLLAAALATCGAHADNGDKYGNTLMRNEARSDILREKILQDRTTVKTDTADAAIAKAVATRSRSQGDVKAAAMAESARSKFLQSVHEAEARIPKERAELSEARTYADKRQAEAKVVREAIEAQAKAKADREAIERALEATARKEAEAKALEVKARREAEERAEERAIKAKALEAKADERAIKVKAEKLLHDAEASKVQHKPPAPKDLGQNIHPDGGVKPDEEKPAGRRLKPTALLGGAALILVLLVVARICLKRCSSSKFQDGDLGRPIIATTGLE